MDLSWVSLSLKHAAGLHRVGVRPMYPRQTARNASHLRCRSSVSIRSAVGVSKHQLLPAPSFQRCIGPAKLCANCEYKRRGELIWLCSSTAEVDPQTSEAPASRSFIFPLRGGGMVNFFVEEHRESEEFRIWVLATIKDYQEPVTLNWGVYREVLDELSPVDLVPEGSVERDDTVCTPLRAASASAPQHLTTELVIPEDLTPCGIAFSITDSSGVLCSDLLNPSKPLTFPIGFSRGVPTPLGMSHRNGKMNFALHSANATGVSIVFFSESDLDWPLLEVALDPAKYRTGSVWHIQLPMEILRDFGASNLLYGFRCEGPLDMSQGHRFLVTDVSADPYATSVAINSAGLLGVIPPNGVPAFDWEDDLRPRIPREKLVVYEMHPAGFTGHESSPASENMQGTFAALMKQIPYLEDLGVNAVLLDPVMASMHSAEHPDFWCKKPASFFAPHPAFGSQPHDPLAVTVELKRLVKAFHSRGIEVWIGARFSNTAEGTDDRPMPHSMRGVDAASYYRFREDGAAVKHSDGGCALNNSQMVVQQLIQDSLCHWVTEYHIDGFHLHNADELQHDQAGNVVTHSKLLENLAFDPVLSAAKIYTHMKDKQTGKVIPHWMVLGERNPLYRDDILSFLRGNPGSKGNFATRLCGSYDRLGPRSAGYGLNTLGGWMERTLVDSVDEMLQPLTTDKEGSPPPPDANVAIGEVPIKHRQVRNAMLAMMLSQGVPVITMGDEYGHTRGGAPCAPPQHGEPNMFRWDALKDGVQGPKAAQRQHAFTRRLVKLRHRHAELTTAMESACTSGFYSTTLGEVGWTESDEPQIAVVFLSSDAVQPDGIYCAFNPAPNSASFQLPPPPIGKAWAKQLDTSKIEQTTTVLQPGAKLAPLAPYSAVVLEAITP